LSPSASAFSGKPPSGIRGCTITWMPGSLGAHLVHMAGQKALMHGAVTLPQHNAAGRELFFCLSAVALPNLNRPKDPHGHLVQRNSHGEPRVAAQVLVGQEEDSLSPPKRPLKGRPRIRRSADQASVLPAKKP